ncbi:hypothetical protein VTP01DRAFT_2583 [Rhizomucor pusillus]|uniref:uncharacterized protein n=1 Tax=Rhizomucor pusillus TaxID=4840 RepID=UPI0037421B98
MIYAIVTTSPCHSFILDLDNPVWQTVFKEQEDREAPVEFKKKGLPEVGKQLEEYLGSYLGKLRKTNHREFLLLIFASAFRLQLNVILPKYCANNVATIAVKPILFDVLADYAFTTVPMRTYCMSYCGILSSSAVS